MESWKVSADRLQSAESVWIMASCQANSWSLIHQAHITGGRPRPWVLREGLSFDLTHDVEHGWQDWAHDTPEGTVPRPDAGAGHRRARQR